MPEQPTRLAILGATGSIGKSTQSVVQLLGERIQVTAISTHSRLQDAVTQAQAMQPKCVVASHADAAREFDWSGLPAGCELLVGPQALETVAAREDVDMVLAAIVGSAGLCSTWAALEAGKPVALANKETLVMAGPLVMRLSAERGAPILPVDSEHSAIFQALQAGQRDQLRRIVLTASGGPFWKYTSQQLSQVTIDQALNHPTWKMGPKITVDSATMMNKALELIEARWLFDLRPDQIDVAIHPQSIVHSMVEYEDGSVIAQLSPPDMRLPIQYALTYPDRLECPAERLDLTQSVQLEFHPPDVNRFPALTLGRDVAAAGGTAGAVLNAANEAAVAEFLEGRLPFVEIVPSVRAVVERHEFEAEPTLERLLQLDQWSREEITKWVCT